MTRLLSIVIVSYNTKQKTLACLASIREHAPAVPVEVVVVDNGSGDGSLEAIRADGTASVVVDAGENLGFARGVNRGVAVSSGDAVLLLNPDTVVLAGALDAIVDFAQAHPDHGVYGGRTLRPDGRVDPSSCWGEPTLWSLTSFALGLSTAFRRSVVFDPESLGRWERDTVREVPIITGCLLLVTREQWDRLGGMDEVFFLYGEDAEFSLRARRRGLRPVVVPGAEIVHEVGASTASSGVKMCMVMAGKATLLRRAWTPWRARAGVALLLGGSALRAALERLRGGKPAWRIVWERRADWRAGYPHAEGAIFGRAAAGSSVVEGTRA